MKKDVVVPKLGPSIEEGILVSWLVKEGAFVKRGTPLFAIETDKSIVDCESTDDGYVGEFMAAEGATVCVDQVLAVLRDTTEAALEASNVAPTTAASAAEIAAPLPASADANVGQHLRASPRARKRAREAGVAFEQLAGSGPNGRIVGRDVEAFIRASVGAVSGSTDKLIRPVRSGKAQDVPLTGMRRAIARRMTESALQTPTFFTTVKIDADRLIELRQQLDRTRSLQVSINDIVVKACALALAKFPQLNATFHGEFVRQHADIDISVAVSVEDGLITPIVRDAGAKSLARISAEIKTFAAQARTASLAPEAYQGGTFTVSNLGMYGVEAFTAIINSPQCAILAVGAIDSELRLRGGVATEHRVMRATLTADHRAVDGALAARFLSELKQLLENPAGLLL